MRIKRKVVVVGLAIVALAGVGAGVASAVSGDEDDAQATGAEADRAREAAARLVPGGTVTAIERDVEQGAVWEVEVRKADGSTAEVRLSESLQQVAIEADSETSDSDG